MGMREKLIELVLRMDITDNVGNIVDFLIANGVTIPVRCKECWKSAEGLCSYQLKNVPGKDFCGDGERRTDD